MSRLDPGRASPLGAHWGGDGVDFAVWSRHAERIEVCVFDAAGARETARFELPGRTGDVHHGRLPGAGPGLVYGLRAHGPYAPHEGHRFNPNKLLLDPYARELVGRFTWDDAVLGYQAGHPDGCDSFDARDSAPFVPKCRVAAPLALPGDRLPRPGRPWDETVLYELHVRGFSALNPHIDPVRRGTIEALGDPASIAHLVRLGVTAVELLPVAAWLDELHLVRRGLVNYWGYNPIGFFAMQPALTGPRGIAAMVDTVERLHAAGIEVILDVVFNHTGEGDERGPTLSLRGLDNASYYLPDTHRAGGYRNHSGCGNTLAAHAPAVGGLILDALRFWAGEVGVDGFRFDLASAIARDAHGRFDPHLPWLRALREDPVLARCKLVAEGWDCDGHFVGRFPAGWSEWNDRFRDDVRRFWRGDPGHAGAIATRLAGSSDLFGHGGRSPAASINFVTAHDGFTLADLVSYRHRRNEANGEDNRDGGGENHSDDCGVEGPSADPGVLRCRSARTRAMLATLMLSRGVPMLRAGDEFGATQGGNNNAYCQDGPLTWLHWPDGRPDERPDGRPDAASAHAGAGDASTGTPAADDPFASGPSAPPTGASDLRPLLATLARLRAALPCLRADHFLHGRPVDHGGTVPDVAWLREDGAPMHGHDWHDGVRRGIAMLLDAGQPAPGQPRDRVWLALCAEPGRVRFRLPDTGHAAGWLRVLDTGDDAPSLVPDADGTIVIDGPALVVCVAGAVASMMRSRWAPGLPAASFVPANDATAAIEWVQPGPGEGAPGPALALDIADDPERASAPEGTARRWRVLPGQTTAVVEACRLDGRRLERHRLALGTALPVGTSRLSLDGTPALLHAVPPRCWLPAAIERPQGAWALSVQLYGLHSAGSWGIGDFDDLASLALRAGASGASGLLVSPVHAPSLGWPDRGSPYSPSSRLALNPLFVSLPRAAATFPAPRFEAWRAQADVRRQIDAVRASPGVDTAAVLALKRTGLRHLWDDLRALRDTDPAHAAPRDFDAWQARRRTALRAHLLFEALAEHHGVADRRSWPAGFETPDTHAVHDFERARADSVAFHAFVQWLAARQWEAVGEAARRAGATIGPIADLAVGADAAGADTWSAAGVADDDHELGAPPDAFAADGQAWGLPPWRPDALAAAGHAPFSRLLQATMHGAGGLRIDHVMALERLFWVPRGRPARDGAYVRYPFEDLLGLVALESVRHRCLVIGEDLGTVRPGLRERLAAAAVLSYKVAWFERGADGTLADPTGLPALAAVCASTHDLPTIDGWAAGLDIDERARLGVIDGHAASHQRAEREADRLRIERGLERAGIAGGDLTDRLHRWLAVSTCRLAIVQLEDVAGLQRQPNLPGTPDVAPNWRQRLPIPLEALADAPRWRRLGSIFARRHASGH